ncbi:signal peptide peptidase SppA [Flavobacterium agricola]|uniref:Signal peptide peptidase SppA n=1 Tax=Flavobacterium agricola TaxID=2870839 RepID=A0ABY6LXJ1_9FLAO|nr:signal peptide peptidase SppA [Flavobacterium agricola]UYW00692.1 signal peptide peptidase SppA [Flavobacterium agricola]
MRFLSNILSTIIGLFLFVMILIFGLIFLGALLGGSNSSKVSVKENSVIELDLAKISSDYGGQYYIKDFDYKQVNNDGFVDVLRALEAAKTDTKIKGISIINGTNNLGLAQLSELRQKLDEFKQTGKFVVAYGDIYSQKHYYLNTIADTVYVNPVGALDFRGLGSEILFYKDFQEKTGIKMEVIRHGKYKSAVEPYLENTISEANREQNLVLLNSIWNSISAAISKSRNITVDSLNSIANNLAAQFPEDALALNMVDKVVYEDEYHNGIKHALGVAKNDAYNKVKIKDYAFDVANTVKSYEKVDKVAVIFAQGTILSGEGDVSYIGEGSIRRSIQEARNNKTVKAIVLRVDSPGGSALTSDLIWREIELTKNVKPVIVSMGNLAASGGYYISCNADKIYADPATITGSIGVFGVVPNIATLSNNIGIHASQVQTHKQAIGYSVFEPMTTDFRADVTKSIEKVYDTFIGRVAKGRNMTKEQVNEIAQGRVWTGAEAVKIGLVDELGSLDDAIAEAAKMAEVENYKVSDFPMYETDFEGILSKLFAFSFLQSKETLVKEYVGEQAYQALEQQKILQKMEGVQAILPYRLDIK